MIRISLVGAGKMGISHLSILGAHSNVEIAGVSDTSNIVLDVLKKYSPYATYPNYEEMLEKEKPDAVFVSVPTKMHAIITKNILLKKMHVFTEKPLCLILDEGRELVDLAKKNQLVNQVGYHNKFIGTFREAKRIIDGGFLGNIHHFTAEAYGPVVVHPKQNNWRADPTEGGGCLMDYASHVIDLIIYFLGNIKRVKGSSLESFYSKNVDDGVYAIFELESNISGILSVNWSDYTYRKMSTSITIIGSKAKLICDGTELKVYFQTSNCPDNYTKGWNVRSISDLALPVNFFLRGEEYSAQVDYFIKAVFGQVPNEINNFQSSLKTDSAISLIRYGV